METYTHYYLSVNGIKPTELSDKRMCFREHSAGAGVTICERRGATYFAVDGKLSGLLW